MKKLLIWWVPLLFIIASIGLQAQSISGTLRGKVTSEAGAALPNAAVTITNLSTNHAQKALTGPDGSFSISGLAPGTYRIDIEIAGYKRTTQQKVELTVAGPTTLNFALQPGPANETVEVNAESPATQPDSGEIGARLGTRQLRELPVLDRNHQQLTDLETGITPPRPDNPVIDPQVNRRFSTNGQAPTVNQDRVDGVTNQEFFRNIDIRVQSTELMQQKAILTSNYNETEGFSGGAIVTDATRAGTNDWHGSAFEFYNGNVFNARNVFNFTEFPQSRLVYNNMGTAFGGPVRKDKTFFFGNYEGDYQNGSITQLSTVPLTQVINGNFSAIPGLTLFDPRSGIAGFGRTPFPGNIIPLNMLNPTAQTLLGNFPAPNLAGLTNNLTSNVPYVNHGNRFDGRFDQHFNERMSAFLRFGFTNDNSHQGSPLGEVIGSGTSNRVLGYNTIAGITRTFGPAVVTEFRFGYNRYVENLNLFGNQSALGAELGLTGLSNNLIGSSIPGFPTIGAAPFIPGNGTDNTFNWNWNWSWHKGRNSFVWGTDIRRIRSDGFTDLFGTSQFGPNGAAYYSPGATLTAGGPALSQFGDSYNSLAAFLLGSPSQIGVTSFLTTPTVRQTQYSVWVGDNVQVTHRLTLDLGLRYELYSPLQPSKGGGAQFLDPTTNTFNYAGIGGIGMSASVTQTRNVAPRFGYAFQATHKTVIRGGYGISYFQNPFILTGFQAPTTGSSLGAVGDFIVPPIAVGALGATVNTVIPNTTPILPPLVNGTPADSIPATVLPRNNPTPYIQSYSTEVQQEFYWGTVLSAGYVGNVGRHLPFNEQLNAALPGTGILGLPFLGLGRTASTLLFDNGINNNYNSLQVKLSKRFSKGIFIQAAYTYGKALGYTGLNNTLLNPFNLRANYGPEPYDRQQILTISHLWELPFMRNGKGWKAAVLGGWQLNGVFTWQGGTPLTITADPFTCLCPGLTPAANFIGGIPSVNGVLNPAAFAPAPTGTFGDLNPGSVRGPSYRIYDFSVFKTFKVMERFHLEFRGEAFNLTNTPVFNNPITNISAADFGQFTSTVNQASGRAVKLGFRVLF